MAKTCQASRIKPLDGNIRLTFTVYRPRKAGDLDNTFKAILDSIKGYAFHDDKQVIEIHAFRDDDKYNPRVEMKVEAI